MNVSLRQLRAFVTVADAGSFSIAAPQLHVTQSALSMLVIQLEQALGVKLFDRTSRQTHLTESGRDFYPNAARVLQELGLALESVSDLRLRKKGIVRIAAPLILASTVLPAVMAAHARKFPDIDLHFTDAMPETLVDSVASGHVDIALGPDQAAEDSLVSRRALVRDRFELICTKDHALARRKKVRWKDVQAHPFIAPSQDFLRRFSADLAAEGGRHPLNVLRTVSYITTALGMVSAGLGVSAGPSYATRLVKAWGLVSRPLVEPVLERDVCLYQSRTRSLSVAAQGFVEFLEEQVSAR
jgi:DNA-binding transcriptional LysR family regulator